jgi:hypothetical protein
MPDDITTDATGLQTDLSLPGDPTSQVAPPNPDVIVTMEGDWNQTKNTIVLAGNKYSLTLLGAVPPLTA